MIKLLLISILIFLCLSKRVIKTLPVWQLNDWQYLTKFGAETGEVFYSLTYCNLHWLRFRIKNAEETDGRTIPMQYELYLDEEWPNALAKSECEVL